MLKAETVNRADGLQRRAAAVAACTADCPDRVVRMSSDGIGASLARHRVLSSGGAAASDRPDYFAAFDQRETARRGDWRRVAQSCIERSSLCLHLIEEDLARTSISCGSACLAQRNGN